MKTQREFGKRADAMKVVQASGREILLIIAFAVVAVLFEIFFISKFII